MLDYTDVDQLFKAGEVAQPGWYQRVDATGGQMVILYEPGYLPASLDGRIALYQRITLAAHLVARARPSRLLAGV